LTVLHNLYRKVWSQHRTTDIYKGLFDSVAAEREWGMAGLACLSRYYQLEPHVAAPNPVQRETWVRATLAENVTVRGIVDRLDLVRDTGDDNDDDPAAAATAVGAGRDRKKGDVVLRLMDYKTGKAPDLKYSPAMNAKIEREAWDQLVLYSLLLRESKNTPIRFLRLIYLGGDIDDDDAVATVWNKRLEQGDMDDMKAKILRLWAEIVEKLSSDDPFRAFSGCSRSFCYCHQCRTKFAPDAVWQQRPCPPAVGRYERKT
jgi:PD-(D/E)XK nuclease superfamily